MIFSNEMLPGMYSLWLWKFMFFGLCLLINGDIEDVEDEELLPGNYPTYRLIPKTEFSCIGKLDWHYYADVDTGCQVFHICQSQYNKISFLCPIGSVFSQRNLVCEWWYNVDCKNSPTVYPENIRIFQGNTLDDSDLSLAASGGNNGPSKEEKVENKVEPKKKENNNKIQYKKF
ncbi:U-scoloptoxin(01)-Cw1a-like [Anthonomus grandis grandis]|uniref:U-scoloptoxin(01)-Cw1a-like n=1 Tax=Anthonomus grandis grandis TaxID=2921223 RepID=UPI002165CAFD|nr:U-scoloptoxin(01)-Cw1a-like [Anthonomus grandis grandis]